jgi:hypothetical protein
MSELGKIIPLSEDEKDLYSRLNFQYFLNHHINSENLTAENVEIMKASYTKTKLLIKTLRTADRAQFQLYAEGCVRKMHSGGMLPCHFNLNEARGFSITDFEEYGREQAFFEYWARGRRRLRIRKLFWKRAVEGGALLGFILAIIHLKEFLMR